MKYKELANKIRTYRINAGYPDQKSFSIALGMTSQQAVSRWETGSTRPKKDSLIKAAKILGVTAEELLILAKYEVPSNSQATPYVKPFPVDSLSPFEFEQFCLKLLDYKYPECKVHIAGSQGHSQDGIDIDVIFPDGTVHTYQCKNEKEFGPKKVSQAVSIHKRSAKKKFLLLSRIASPQSRLEINKHNDWDIWDKEDISNKVRDLSIAEQKRIVSLFFRGQSLSLLGDDDLSPFQSPDDFYLQFNDKKSIFNHSWDIIGRDKELEQISNSLNTQYPITVISGAGGIGKSKVIKELLDNKAFNIGNKTWLLSPPSDITKKALVETETLDNSSRLIVIDDAHEEGDLDVILSYVAQSKNVKLLISTRSYGLSKIINEINRHIPVFDKASNLIEIYPLDVKEATELSKQVLSAKGADVDLSHSISKVTGDCTLATVIGSYIVAENDTPVALLANEEKFKGLLFSKFESVIAGKLSDSIERSKVSKILTIISLVQPFDTKDDSIAEILKELENIDINDYKQTINLLVESGLLFRRGNGYRLSPDMLSDYIIQKSCTNDNGESLGYAEKVFKFSPPRHLENILINLGKLDWKLNSGDTSHSRFLTDVWKVITREEHVSDHLAHAVKAVAFYQPEKALEYVDACIRKNDFKSTLPDIIKYAAYNYGSLRQSCELLWDIITNENNNDLSKKKYALSVLTDMATVEPNKPLYFIEFVVDFSIELLKYFDTSKVETTPFDILKGAMKTYGHTSEYDGKVVTTTRFNVNHAAIKETRKKIIDSAIELLSSNNLAKSIMAASFLHKCISPPINSETSDWYKEFEITISGIYEKVQSTHDLTLIEILRTLHWTHRGNKEFKDITDKVFKSLPNTIDFKVRLALIDGNNQLFNENPYEIDDSRPHIAKIVNELRNKFSSEKEIFEFVSKLLIEIDSLKAIKSYYPFFLFEDLSNKSEDMCLLILDYANLHPDSVISKCVSNSIYSLYKVSESQARKQALRIIDSKELSLMYELASALPRVLHSAISVDNYEIDIIKALNAEANVELKKAVIRAINKVIEIDKAKGLELLSEIDISKSSTICDEVLSIFREQNLPVSNLNSDYLNSILDKMVKLYKLDGYWIEQFLVTLAKIHPVLLSNFIKSRLSYCSEINDWKYEVIFDVHRDNQLISFESDDIKESIFNDLIDWIIEFKNKNPAFNEEISSVIKYLFGSLRNQLIESLNQRLAKYENNVIDVLKYILKKLDNDFIFDNQEFIETYLGYCKRISREKYLAATNSLYSETVYGKVRTRIPGEASQSDIDYLEQVKSAKARISQFSPLFDLYSQVEKHAEGEISFADDGFIEITI